MLINDIKNKDFLIHAFISLLWVSLLSKTSSYVFIYILIMAISIFAAQRNNNVLSNKQSIVTILFSFLLSFFVTTANYKILLISNLLFIILFFLLLFLGTIVFRSILVYIFENCSKVLLFDLNKTNHKKIFVLSFLLIVCIDLIVLFLSEYPGELTLDSIIQLTQINTGVYSNHHPFWHTMIIKVFYNFGYCLFGNVNAAIATYFVFQIIIMALIESYANMTLSQLGSKKTINILFCLFFMFMPFNFLYSITMWKDVLFSGSVLLFVTCLIRIFYKLGNMHLTYTLFSISSIGFGILRTNGLYALVFTFVLFFILFYRKYSKSLFIMLICIVISFVMRGPVLSYLNIPQPDLIESLSIPAQQIARVIYDGKDLSKDNLELLNKVVEVDKIAETYYDHISDPIKNLVRERNNQDYIKNHMSDYLKLYIDLGIKYPFEYFEAYVDQTKGYFNGGYRFWIVSTDILENDLGVVRYSRISGLHNAIVFYENLFYNLDILNPLISIGLHTWILIAVLYLGIMKKNKETIILTIPLLAIVGTLLIATPIYSEFRYAYSVFTSTYFIILCCFKNIMND